MISIAVGEARAHAIKLQQRCPIAEIDQSMGGHSLAACQAAIDYLASMIIDPKVTAEAYAAHHAVQVWHVQTAAAKLRQVLHYREYVGEWIREGKPALHSDPEPARVLHAVSSNWHYTHPKPPSERFRNSWTGSVGTKSYPDKDSSPE